MARELFTYYDAIEHLQRYSANRGLNSHNIPTLRAACISAYQECAEAYQWLFSKQTCRINLIAAESTGTVAFDLTGGTYEYQLTLTDSTWNANAIDWSVAIDDVVYDIASRESSTVVTLDPNQAPTADIAAGETYEAFPRYYALPEDFQSLSDPMPEATHTILGTHVSMEELLSRMRSSPDSGEPAIWSIGPIPDAYGRFALYIYPPANTSQTVDFIYRAKPRELRFSGHEKKCSAGTITVVSGSATVTGSSTTFEDLMEGCILRIGDSTTVAPTGLAGQQPWVEQRSILLYTSGTVVTLDANVVTSRSGTKYTVTDPIDLDPGSVPAFLRMAERQLLYDCGKYTAADETRCRRALMNAKAAQNRTTQRRIVAGHESMIPLRPITTEYTVEE